jgi:transcriptional regulator with XRE-family HTH domain
MSIYQNGIKYKNKYTELIYNNLMNEKIKRLRLSLGLTQKEFAQLIGLKNQETYSRYESGSRQIPIDLLMVISDKTNTSLDSLIKKELHYSFVDKYDLDQKTEELLFRKSMYQIVFSAAEFEGINVTLLDTKQLVDNKHISNIKIDDVIILRDMHKATQYILEKYQSFNFDNLLELHSIAAKNDALNPGTLRSGIGGVDTKQGLYIPPIVNEGLERIWFDSLISDNKKSASSKSIEIFLHLSRGQIFNDTNKRTALLAANVPLLQSGAGVLYISENMFPNFMSELSDYYFDTESDEVIRSIYCLGISDFDGKTFYEKEHQNNQFGEIYLQLQNAYKAYGAKVFTYSDADFSKAGFDKISQDLFYLNEMI